MNFSFLAIGLFLVIPCEASEALYHLSSGSKLTLVRSLTLKANQWDIPLRPSGKARCVLRLKQSQPYSRTIQKHSTLEVTQTQQSGFAAKRQISQTTYVLVNSPWLQDITCSSFDSPTHLKDFISALQPFFRLH